MRRRKTKFNWFPVLGTIIETESAAHPNAFIVQCRPNPDSGVSPGSSPQGTDVNLTAVALVPDYTIETGASDLSISLNDYVQGQDWALARIVGQCHVCTASSGAEGAIPPNLLVTAGFCVARSQDQTQNLIDTADFREFDPQNVDNIRQPWIWRRTWMLGTSGNNLSTGAFPSYNTFASNMSGSFIDAKSRRRIRKEERLWFCMSAIGIDNSRLTWTLPQDQQPLVTAVLDIRILGAMRRSRNKSSF